VGLEPLRPPALRALLPALHREGLGVPTSELRAEWAAQRIKGLSFFSASRAGFRGNPGNRIKSLIDQFHYPRLGPGQMWDAMTIASRPPAARFGSALP